MFRLSRLIVLLFCSSLCCSAMAEGVSKKERRWIKLERQLKDLMPLLAGQSPLLYRCLSEDSYNYWPTGVSHSKTIESILPRPYCRESLSCFTPFFYKSWCLPFVCFRPCTNTASGIKGLQESDDFHYKVLFDVEKAAQEFHFDKYSDKRRSVVLTAGRVSDLMAQDAEDDKKTVEDEDKIILLYRKCNDHGCLLDRYKVFADGCVKEDDFALEDIKRDFIDYKYLRLFHSRYLRDWDGSSIQRKPNEAVSVKRITMNYFKLSEQYESFKDVDVKLAVNYYDSSNKKTRSCCIDVPFAISVNGKSGYCNLFEIQPNDAKAVVTIIRSDITLAAGLLITFTDYIAAPLIDVIASEKDFSFVNITNSIIKYAYASEENERNDGLLKKVKKWVKNKLSDEVIGGFVVKFDQLESLPETFDSKFRVITTNEGHVIYLKLWD